MTTSATMRVLNLEAYSSPFQLWELPRPIPNKGQVRVRVKASGVNPLDTRSEPATAHAKQPLPAILGMDLAGVVEVAGASVTAFKVGDEVYGLAGGVGGLQGSLPEFAAVDADLLARKPANLTMREAAAVPLGFITAWEGLVDRVNSAGVGAWRGWRYWTRRHSARAVSRC